MYQPETGESLNKDPFKAWTNEELLRIGFAGPEQFAPGTNWGYSHTNYVVLGEVLEKITGKPLSEVMDEYVIGPWITRTKSFAGSAATAGYLPEEKLTISIAMTYSPDAFDDGTSLNDSSRSTFEALVDIMAPGSLPNAS